MDTCSRGHANPDGTAFCSTCGLALAANQRQTPAGATATALRPDAQFDAWGQPHPDRQDAPPSAAGRRGPSGWAIGLAACAAGVAASYRYDLPYGPTLVLAMGAAFAAAVFLRVILPRGGGQRSKEAEPCRN